MDTSGSQGTSAGRWYYGWNIVAAASVITLMTVGMRMGVGPFFMPIIEDLGFSRSVFSGIVAVGMLFYGLAMPLAGWLVGRIGTRGVLLIGIAIVVLSTWWTINATTPWTMLMAFGVMLSTGLAFTSPVAMTAILTKWFNRRRGMALFFLATGSMAGIAVLTPLFALLISWIGWRWTMMCYALVFAVLTVPAALWIFKENAPVNGDAPLPRSSKEKAKPAPAVMTCTFGEAVRTTPFWKICAGLFACGFSMNLLGTHGIPMLEDRGFSTMTASGGIGTIGLVAIFSTLVLGRIADRIPRRLLLATIYIVRGVGFLALLVVMTPFQLYLVAAIAGLVWAGSLAMASAILADTYGVRLVGVLYGWSYLGHQIGAAISSWFGGWGYEHLDSHWPAFGAAAVLLFFAGWVSLKLPGRQLNSRLVSA
ncbi:MFS transporter [Orrella sp. 11846]|uniref:MFS transporter n=1 Tax=Orrella sp. 11846 TaxID=3409913 RepID=UPI003B5A3221